MLLQLLYAFTVIVCIYSKYDHVVRQQVFLPELTSADVNDVTLKWVLYTTWQEVQVRYKS